MNLYHTPWAFALLAAIPLAVFLHLRPGRRAAVRFSSVEGIKKLGPTFLFRIRHVPLLIRVAVLVLLVLAIARPRQGTEKIVEHNRGIALEMVVDRSGSMGEEMKYAGERVNRLEAAKGVFREFVIGSDKGLEGRKADLIGMVAFARYADTVCPLTHNHGALAHFIEATNLVTLRSEDGTAIGDALALAAARLKTAEDDLRKKRIEGTDEAFTIQSKAIVLITDGRYNAGKRHPIEAARLAKEWGIKIYCIGIGGERLSSAMDFFFRRQANLDEDMLEKIAGETGGFYQKATDENSLRNIYKKIDELEKSQLVSERYVNYKERFARWAVPAFFLLLMEAGLANTVFRRIP